MLDITDPIETTLGKRIVNLRPIGRGYSPAQRIVVSFAKRGVTSPTAEWLRREKVCVSNL
ncbi:MAG: hypothetical protein KF893_13860 [Caldilineaceae bacterium]|nr:hypothetical protein [Caldilineaceae bacterium]